MTNNLIERSARWWRLAALALALGLAACGPGTGGTGTGPLALSYGFSGTSGGAVFAPSAGGAGCDKLCQINLRLEEQRVTLEQACTRFSYTGPWAVDGKGQLVLKGTVERTTAKGLTLAPGTLQLQFSGSDASSSQVTILLLSDTGTALLGQLQLRSDDAVAGGTVPPLACAPS